MFYPEVLSFVSLLRPDIASTTAGNEYLVRFVGNSDNVSKQNIEITKQNMM
jgi:hypothetical protein